MDFYGIKTCRESSQVSCSEKFDPSREEFERYKRTHTKKKLINSKNKKQEAIYKDPIFGVAHNHDPTLQVIINKRDPIRQMNESMRQMTLKSQMRLKHVQNSKPRYMHTRFNIDALKSSPLMCFPHFEEMVKFLISWYNNRGRLKQEMAGRGISQQATFNAKERFCDSLFLLLQEASKANPLVPAPLAGIYKWFLNRDTMIQQSKQINLQSQDLPYILIELPNGEEVHVMKKNLDFNQVAPKQAFRTDNLMRVYDEAKVIHDEEEEIIIEREIPVSKARILRDVNIKPLPKEEKKDPLLYDKFDYHKLHERLKREREEEKEVDAIADSLIRRYSHGTV